MPETRGDAGTSDADMLLSSAYTYLHRVGRAGRFGIKGMAISFVSSEKDESIIKKVEERFESKIQEYDASTMNVKSK